MTKDEALKLALEALEYAEAGLADIGDADREPGDDLAWCERRAAQALPKTRATITAIREALAQPEQEPAGYADKIGFESAMKAGKGCDVWPVKGDYEARTGRALIALYPTPPQRKPLLASDIVTMYDENPRSDSEMIAFARAIEAAHGIKE